MPITRLIHFQGKTQSVSAWAYEKNLSVTSLFGRLRNGWSIESALTEPQVSRHECGKRGSRITMAMRYRGLVGRNETPAKDVVRKSDIACSSDMLYLPSTR